MKIVRCMLLGMGLGDMFCVCGFPLFNHIINSLAILSPVYRIAMELYEAVSRRMGIPEVVIRVFMGYMVSYLRGHVFGRAGSDTADHINSSGVTVSGVLC